MNNELKQALISAPVEIREFLASEEFGNFVGLATSTLKVEWRDVFLNEVLIVFLGLDISTSFKSNLVKFGIDPQIAEVLTRQTMPVLKPFEELLPSELEAVAATDPHPVIEPGEVAHNTTPEEKAFMNTPALITAVEPAPPTTAHTTPQAHYPGGIDPYREPID